jgi:hypothetical protein
LLSLPSSLRTCLRTCSEVSHFSSAQDSTEAQANLCANLGW